MSKNVKRITALVLALALALGIGWYSKQSALKASEGDGYDTAAELQETKETASEVVVITVAPEVTAVPTEEPAAVTETAEPQTVEEPEVTEEPEAIEPEATEEPEAVESEVTEEPEVVEPEVTEEPEAIEPEVTEEPEAVEPEATEEPEAVEPEVTEEPEAVEPEATEEPEVVEPETTEEPEAEAVVAQKLQLTKIKAYATDTVREDGRTEIMVSFDFDNADGAAIRPFTMKLVGNANDTSISVNYRIKGSDSADFENLTVENGKLVLDEKELRIAIYAAAPSEFTIVLVDEAENEFKDINGKVYSCDVTVAAAEEATETETIEPEVTDEPETTETETTEPEVTDEPETTETETTEPEVTDEPETTETTEPEVTDEPETAETETTEPEVIDEPETAETETTEPEVTDEPETAEEAEVVLDIELDKDPSTLKYGDELTLKAVVTGAEEGTYSIKWQSCTADGEWTDIPGATETEYTIIVSDATVGISWRFVIDVK